MAGDPANHSQNVVNSGTSVLACKYADGIMIATDTNICYGSFKEYKHQQRIVGISEEAAIACSGEMSDFQEIQKTVKEMSDADMIQSDGHKFLRPRDYFNYLSNVHYRKRMKVDPWLCSTVVGGVRKDNGELFLGCSDFFGTKIERDYILTGMAAYYCNVLMEADWSMNMTEAAARKMMEKCLSVLYLRDKKASDEIQICKVTREGVVIDKPYTIASEWGIRDFKERNNEFFRPFRVWY